MNSKIETLIKAREKDLGGFKVRRVLPYASHRMVGPFIFFDHMGPAQFKPQQRMDVRPHPHIGLSTVTYLFQGEILHRDSLGSLQPIQPGAVNWMTAGRGIVHSERTPSELEATGFELNGIQCWIALPESHEEIEPTFSHHPSNTLPEFSVGPCQLKLLLGSAFGHKSPVPVSSEMFYLELQMPKGSEILFPTRGLEGAAYIVKGQVEVEQTLAQSCEMIVAKVGQDMQIKALSDSHLMLLGGASVGPRFIWWNLASSSQEKLKAAREDWLKGPRVESMRFQPIPDDHSEFIPAPPEDISSNPKGTIM